MWTVPRQLEDPDERDNRLLAQYEEEIAHLGQAVPFWDGFCGLVKLQDEDYVGADAMAHQNTAAPASSAQQQQRQHQQRPDQQRQARHARSGSAGMHTPPAGSPRSSPGSSPLKGGSPFKSAPGAGAPRQHQSASQLAEDGSAQLQQGRLTEAEELLHSALRRCPPSDITLAGRIVDLLVDAERERLETPTHSHHPSWEAGDQPPAAASGDAASADALLRQALAALGTGEQRRAAELLRQAAGACPPDLAELQRRIELFSLLARTRRQL